MSEHSTARLHPGHRRGVVRPEPKAHAYKLAARERPARPELPSAVDANGVPAPMTRLVRLRARLSRFYRGVDVAAPDGPGSAREREGTPEPAGDEFTGVSETGIPRGR